MGTFGLGTVFELGRSVVETLMQFQVVAITQRYMTEIVNASQNGRPLPAGFGDGTHTVTVTGAETLAGHDLYLYFMDASCVVIGGLATSAANESGVIPGGAAYVLTQLWTGANVPFTLTAADAG